jgi:hypothetical protein
VQWNADLPDPDVPAIRRQIDVLITRDGRRTAVECRLRKGAQDVMWIEELAGRKLSLGLDGLIAVSYDGFTKLAKIKAKRFGIALIDHEDLTDAEIASWGEAAQVETTFVVFSRLEIIAGVPAAAVAHLAAVPIFLTAAGNDGYGAVMDQLRNDVTARPGAALRKQLSPAGFFVDGIPLTLLECDFSGTLVPVKASCTALEMVGDPDVPAQVRDVSVQRFDESVPEVIRTRDGVHLVIDASAIGRPPNSIAHEIKITFQSITKLQSYELIGRGVMGTPASTVALIITRT